MLQLFGDLTTQTYLQFLSIFLEGFSNWGSFYTEEDDGGITIRISHSLGSKWSLFLRGYLESSSLEVVSKKPEFKHVFDYSIIMKL